ncbi:hypothetical protein ABT168_08610 [Streptomyces sp. NPDC001793]|uniref:hypothetical protein n=1 Tax=Streptomyces sp. NPDC001793 TaxID=3154657 RepID=UPI00331B0CF1
MRKGRHTADSDQAEFGVHPVPAYEQLENNYPDIKGTYQSPTPAMRQGRLGGP